MAFKDCFSAPNAVLRPAAQGPKADVFLRRSFQDGVLCGATTFAEKGNGKVANVAIAFRAGFVAVLSPSWRLAVTPCAGPLAQARAFAPPRISAINEGSAPENFSPAAHSHDHPQSRSPLPAALDRANRRLRPPGQRRIGRAAQPQGRRLLWRDMAGQ